MPEKNPQRGDDNFNSKDYSVISQCEGIAEQRFKDTEPQNPRIIFSGEAFMLAGNQLYRCDTNDRPEKYEGEIRHVPLRDLME